MKFRKKPVVVDAVRFNPGATAVRSEACTPGVRPPAVPWTPCPVCASQPDAIAALTPPSPAPLPVDAPAPVTHRAGAVPPRIEVGMVLRSSAGEVLHVTETNEHKARVTTPDGYVHVVGPREDFATWPLARDWTEPTEPK